MNENIQLRTTGKLIGRNAFWNFGGQAWAVALAFFTTPYVVHNLGADSYGLLMTVGVVTSYFAFSDLQGLRTGDDIEVRCGTRGHGSVPEWKDIIEDRFLEDVCSPSGAMSFARGRRWVAMSHRSHGRGSGDGHHATSH